MDANLTPAGSEYTLGKDLMIFETNFSPKNQVIPDTPCFSGRVAGPGDSSEEGLEKNTLGNDSVVIMATVILLALRKCTLEKDLVG